MKEQIYLAVYNATTLANVRDGLFTVFTNTRKEGQQKIGYVSGIITSEGRENIPRNIDRLAKFTEHIRTQQDFPVFSPTDVFYDELIDRLVANNLKNDDFIQFWREVLGAEEKFITDIFMTPRWELSQGATDEHDLSKKLGLTIHYIETERI